MTTARALLEEKMYRRNERRIEASRESFWEYCVTRAPSFYKKDRPHLKVIAETLEKMIKAY